MGTIGRGWVRSLEIFQEVLKNFLVTAAQSEAITERILNDIINNFTHPLLFLH